MIKSTDFGIKPTWIEFFTQPPTGPVLPSKSFYVSKCQFLDLQREAKLLTYFIGFCGDYRKQYTKRALYNLWYLISAL